MNRWMVLAFVVIGLLFGVGIALGTRVPVQHTATATAVYPVSVETLWTAVTDYRGYPIWRSGVDSVQTLPDIQGRAAWIESGRSGELEMVIEESVPPMRFVTRILGEEAFGGSWTFELGEVPGEDGDQARLTITENGEIYNAFFRFVSHYIVGYEATMTRFLADLDVYLREMIPAEGLPPRS